MAWHETSSDRRLYCQPLALAPKFGGAVIMSGHGRGECRAGGRRIFAGGCASRGYLPGVAARSQWHAPRPRSLVGERARAVRGRGSRASQKVGRGFGECQRSGYHRGAGTNHRATRRARASCADIGARILGSARAAGRSSPRQMECGAADRIPQDTLLERNKTVGDSMLGSWDVFTRCVHPGDCVPFLVRVPGGEFPPEIAPSARQVNSSIAERAMAPSSAARATLPVGKPLVLPGEAVTLLWDQDGIRLVVPAVCLDAGGPGQAVRARIARGGRMVRAIVVSAGKLRTAS